MATRTTRCTSLVAGNIPSPTCEAFADDLTSVPQDDQPILTIDSGYVEAYAAYLTKIDQSKLANSGTVLALSDAQGEYNTALAAWNKAQKAAAASYKTDCM